MQDQPFCYDPDFRRNPKDVSKPYCIRCQQNVNVARAVPVTFNDETWMAVVGHGRHEEIRTNFNPQAKDLVCNGYIGRDCYAVLQRDVKQARSARK